ncbi:hypothetical protein K3162_12300 [Qipengyuania xiapuensis]|uniref:Uncharacterized protein n=1 Tax=Qipengyuania xiapuensis TaxID=2867236 RepID=A0ABX8ZTE4_9SPHN|nr:hypothetical protein [Qipengyuania xiapuensis]QZD92301.1 hypothetical protein K3162_12300 [Qipengyuania xiapuensis]
MGNEDLVEDYEWTEERSRSERFREILGQAEKIYLEVLRAAALIVATLILGWIVWLLLSSAYRIAQDPNSVEVEPVSLTAEEVIDIDMGEAAASERNADPEEPNVSAFDTFAEQYHRLFKEKFEKYRHKDDAELSAEQFADRYLSGFDEGEGDGIGLGFGSPVSQSDYDGLLAMMREASNLPENIERLETYRDTPKVRREEQVRKTRRERYCSYYSDYFGRCYGYDYRTVPYTETVVRMESPDGILDHRQLFGAYQGNYLTKLNARRDANLSAADSERAERRQANAEGWLGLGNALWFAGLFMALMFFFLLIAIERHQRQIAIKLENK